MILCALVCVKNGPCGPGALKKFIALIVLFVH